MPYDNYYDGPDTQGGSSDSPRESKESLIQPVKDLYNLDSSVDDAFEKLITDMSKNQTLLNNINNVQIADASKLLSSLKKPEKEKPFKETVRDEYSKLDKGIFELLNDVVVPKKRLDRYKAYNSLSNELQIATKIQTVYLDNMLVKNPYTKKFLDVTIEEEFEKMSKLSINDKKVIIDLTKAIMTFFELQKKLKNDIFPKQLMLGNFFVEILDVSIIDDLNEKEGSLSIINEADAKKTDDDIDYVYIDDDKFTLIDFDFNEDDFGENSQVIEESAAKTATPSFAKQLDILFENSKHREDVQKLYQETENVDITQLVDIMRDLDITVLRDIKLSYVSPENCIMLLKDGVNFGYLVIEEGVTNSSVANSRNGEVINVVKRFMDTKGDKTDTKTSEIKFTEEKIDKIIGASLKKLYQRNPAKKNMSQLLELITDEDTATALRSVLYSKYKKYSKVRVRYVPPTRMTNFTNPINKYGPYGTSVIDPIMLSGKLYLLGLLSSIISRLNRASVIRKWTIETGAHRNHSEIVENFKQELRNTTITFDDLTSLKEVSNNLTDYKDVVTIQQNGKRFVDLDIMPTHDRSLPMNDLDQLKQQLIQDSGVPSIMLNSADTYELRESLVQVNINFANTINSFQDLGNDAIENLLSNVFNLILEKNKVDTKVNLSSFVDIKLNPPLILTLQHLEGTVSGVSNLINLLTNMNVPVDPVWMLKRFIKVVDWETVQKEGQKYIQNKKIAEMANTNNNSSSGMGY